MAERDFVSHLSGVRTDSDGTSSPPLCEVLLNVSILRGWLRNQKMPAAGPSALLDPPHEASTFDLFDEGCLRWSVCIQQITCVSRPVCDDASSSYQTSLSALPIDNVPLPYLTLFTPLSGIALCAEKLFDLVVNKVLKTWIAQARPTGATSREY